MELFFKETQMADNCIETNEYGMIVIGKPVIIQIVSEVVEETGGVRLASFKEMLKKRKNSIDISFDSDGQPEINVFVVVDFGYSISNITYNIINEVKNRVMIVMDRPPSSVNVTVVATQTKRNKAKRNLKFRRSYDISE